MIQVKEDGMMTCPHCHRTYLVELAQAADWIGKLVLTETKLIQDVWPKAEMYQREQLMTGLCSDQCWTDYLVVSDD